MAGYTAAVVEHLYRCFGHADIHALANQVVGNRILVPAVRNKVVVARSAGTLKKVLESYKKKDLLILDEWLIRPLSPQESYDMLEIVEARCRKSTIFCTQYESEGWYTRIDPNPESDSPVSEAIMDRIIYNAYEVLVDGRVSMRERKGLKAVQEGGSRDV